RLAQAATRAASTRAASALRRESGMTTGRGGKLPDSSLCHAAAPGAKPPAPGWRALSFAAGLALSEGGLATECAFGCESRPVGDPCPRRGQGLRLRQGLFLTILARVR